MGHFCRIKNAIDIEFSKAKNTTFFTFFSSLTLLTIVAKIFMKKATTINQFMRWSLLLISFSLLNFSVYSQTKENSQAVSKGAKKGILVDALFKDDGNIALTYKTKVDKKSDDVLYEDYVFDKNLNYIGIQPTKENKQIRPDQKMTTVAAFVGGSNSFNVMSMSLTLQQEVWERNWNYDRQTYQWGKRLSKETVKPKNNNSKYRGFAAFNNNDDGSVLVIASYDQAKEDDDQFVFLYISNDLELKETKVPVSGSYSLDYCGALESGNAFALFAPNKKMADTKKYTLVEFTNKGELVSSNDFTAPSPNTLIMDFTEANGDLFLVAASDKSNDAFNQVFTSYAPIDNPGYTTSQNRQMDKYEKKVFGQEFDNFHLLRFSKGKLLFASTTPIKDFKSKVVNPPSQRKSHTYNGKKMIVQKVVVTPSGDLLVAGQLSDRKMVSGSYLHRYYDYVCLHLDPNGNLKAQYAVEKEFDDRKNETYGSPQNFILSADGKSAYWELLEVKVVKYYKSAIDAFNGNYTISPHYFPRIVKINLSSNSMGDFTGLGNKGKFLVYNIHRSLMDEKNSTIYYIGHDEDYDKVWLGKYTFD